MVVVLGRFGAMVPIDCMTIPSVSDGTLHLNSILRDVKLPDADMVAIISPSDLDGAETNNLRAFGALSLIRSVLSLHFGKLATFSRFCDFNFDSEGVVSIPGKAFRMPLFADFISFADASISNEVLSALATCRIDFRTKFQQACSMINSALDQDNEAFRFSAYWLALEIIGGKSGALKSKLAQAYGAKIPFVENFLRFKEIAQMRHDLMHDGKFGFFYSYQERLLQTYFWDIARYQLKLQCRGLSKALVESGTVDEELGQLKHSK